MKSTVKYIIAIYVVLSLVSGCRHKPVYPTYGAVYIESNPTGAEILIDGESTKRQTPVKIDAISAGEHEISLRMFGMKLLRHNVTIEGGMTKRLYLSLQLLNPQIVGSVKITDFADDLALEPLTSRLYLANRSNNLYIFQANGPVISGPIESIFLGNNSWQRSVAVSNSANRIYACLWTDTVKSLNFNTNQIIKSISIPGAGRMTTVKFTNDGSLAFIADSLAKKIWIIDTASDSLNDSICLSGTPSDLVIEPGNRYLYVTILDDKVLQEIDIIDKTVTRSIATGNNPGGMFNNVQCSTIGFCNRDDKNVTIVNRYNWATGTGPAETLLGEKLPGASLAGDNSYLWLLETKLPYPSGDDLLCDSSTVALIYMPTWKICRRFAAGQYAKKIIKSTDGRYVYILANYSMEIIVLQTDTE